MILGDGNDSKKNKTIISIIVSIGIIAISIIYILWINNPNEINHYHAQNGIIDLSNWDSSEGTNIYLDGKWEFYPNLLLTPQNDFSQYRNIKKYVHVPGSWESYLNDDGSVDGSGTYRLRINLPSDDIYGIKSRTIRFSSRIFINDEEIISTGNPSLDTANYEAQSKYKVAFATSENQVIDLIVQVSSYGYISGGIIRPLEFGTYESIIRRDQIQRGIEALIITISLTLFIYSFMIYIQRTKDKYNIYFSGISLFMAIYLSTVNEQLLNMMFNYSFYIRLLIQTFSLMFVAICILRFTHHLYFKYSNKKHVDIITGIILLNLLIITINLRSLPFLDIEKNQGLVIISTLISYSYTFFVILKAIRNKVRSLEYILVIIISASCYWFAFIFKLLFELDLGYLSSLLTITMMISTALLINNNLQLNYIKTQSLSRKLIKEDELKDEFLARVSHKMETHLNVISNSSRSLIEGEKGVINPDQQESLYFISQEGKRLLGLVNNLLDASQINLEKIDVKISHVNIYRIINSILREMRTLIPYDKDIKLANQVQEDFPLVLGDQGRISQIVYNLIDNAIKFSESGEIVVVSQLKDGKAMFKVIDQGIGIKEEDQEVIFEKFYKDTNFDNQGLGLGLPISKHLIEIMGGEISVDSNYGIGTNVSFSLPLYEGEEVTYELASTIEDENQVEPAVNQDYEINRSTILIADDIKANHKLMTEILSEFDYNLLFAEDGQDTLEIVEKNKVDLIVLDYLLPDMSSNDVCKKIREKFSMTELPVIVLTASGRTIDLEELVASGVNDYIRKSADKEELVSRIKSLLSMKESVKEGLIKEFQYFYSQISPHFLYNTINTIIGLSYKNPEKTRKALTNLAIYFRGKLELYKDQALISLESELELVTAYLEIEQMRHGDKLRVKMSIEEDLDTLIPPLTIQPLVENSIRHGIKPKGEGNINIVAKSQEDLVIIRIEDDGMGMSEEKQKKLLSGESDRLGFKNVIEKIKIIKGANLKLYSKEKEGTTIIITLPEVNKYASNISG